MARRYKCPYCDDKYERKDLIEHIDKKHEDLIPENFTSTRIVFNLINKRECGFCRVCNKETKWREDLGRYDILCENPKCKEELRRRYQENMIRVRGTDNILNDPEQQKKMLANRSISGKYKFTDGGVLTFTGSYEKKYLEFIDKVLEIPSKDILCPGPTLEYEMNGEKHFYITDSYLIPQNLIVEVKDGGDNLNTKDTPGMRSSRERTLAKEKLITESGEYNYIRLTNNNFAQLLDVLMEIKEAQFDKRDGKIIKVNESYVTENNIINNKDLEFNLDKWKPGNKNILFITGLSGSGKSTKAAKLAKEYNAVNIELDLFEHNYVVFDKNVTNDEGNLIVKEYFENKFGGAKKFKQGDKQLPHMMYDFIKYCMNYAYKHKDKLFIIEGIQLSDLEMANEIKDYPIIIVRTSIINSIYRAAKREGIKNYIKSFESYKDFLDLYKWYLSMDKNNKKFAKELEESYITEGIIDNYRFLDVKKDKSEVLKYLKKSNMPYAEDIIENYIGEIIVDKDKMIGRIFVGNKKDKGFIVDLEISKAYRGQKLGNKLIDDAIKKYNGIDLLVDKDNEIALSMYKKRGFVIVKEINNQYYMKLKSKLTKDDKVVNESVVTESSNINLYHLSTNNLDSKILKPRIPDNFLVKNGYENSTIKRVCFATSIDKCLRAMSYNIKGIEFYVHIPDKKYNTYKPSVKEVPDCKITGEIWIREPVKLKCIGKIKVIKDKGEPGLKYQYGDKEAELYDWDYELVEKINESYIAESSSITLYHGTDNPDFDLILPNSYNVGTHTTKPRMSSYWFDNAEYAKIFATMTVLDNNLTKDPNGRVCLDNDMSILVPNKYKITTINLLKNSNGYVYYRTITNKSIISRGHARYFPEYTIDVPIKPDGIIKVSYKDMINNIKFVDQEYYDEVMHKYATDNIRYDISLFQQIFDIVTKYSTGDIPKRKRELKKLAKFNSLGESVDSLNESDIEYLNNYIL